MYLEVQVIMFFSMLLYVLFHSSSQCNVANSVLTAYKLSVAPEMDILEYSKKEWRGNTPVAKSMRKVYFLFADFIGLFAFISVFHRWLSTRKIFLKQKR